MVNYKVVFEVSKKQAKTKSIKNASAREWLRFKLTESTRISDIVKILIVEDKFFKDHVLDEIEAPERSGKGKYYEYRMQLLWNWF